VRPSLECLETRDAPAARLTSLTFSNVSSSFSLASLSMTDSTSNGQASFTFTFGLAQLLSNPLLLFPHTVTANYSDSSNVFGSSSGSVAAPGAL
jgi:hypothetical protein